MLVIEDRCVGCPPEMGCMGSACPNHNVEIRYCDCCKGEEASYVIEGEDYCKYCADEYMKEAFSTYLVEEQARMMDIDFEYI